MWIHFFFSTSFVPFFFQKRKKKMTREIMKGTNKKVKSKHRQQPQEQPCLPAYIQGGVKGRERGMDGWMELDLLPSSLSFSHVVVLIRCCKSVSHSLRVEWSGVDQVLCSAAPAAPSANKKWPPAWTGEYTSCPSPSPIPPQTPSPPFYFFSFFFFKLIAWL